MTTTKKNPTKFAFWPYDLAPYVLGSGTNGKRDKEGRVEVPAYGKGAMVKPLVVMSAEKGRAILTEIQRRDAIRRASCATAYQTFRDDVLSVAPFMKRILKTD